MTFSLLKNIVLFYLSFFLLASCAANDDGQIKVPTNVLNEEQFTKVLVDFALAESTGNINVKNISINKSDSVYAFDPLKENNVSKAMYDSAISFYSKHPTLYKKIYENVLATLSKMQVKPDSAKVAPVSK